jgi:hypothetical protein
VDKKFSYVLEKNSQSHVLKMIRTQCGWLDQHCYLFSVAQTKKETATKTAQNGQEKQDVVETNVKRKEPLLLLALHVASHLDWNLGHLETGLVSCMDCVNWFIEYTEWWFFKYSNIVL